jgi:hypothetical protein
MGSLRTDDHIIVFSKMSHEELPIEGSNSFSSLLLVGFSGAQTQAFFDKFHISNFLETSELKNQIGPYFLEKYFLNFLMQHVLFLGKYEGFNTL